VDCAMRHPTMRLQEAYTLHHQLARHRLQLTRAAVDRTSFAFWCGEVVRG